MAMQLQDGNTPCLVATPSDPRPTILMFDSGIGGLSVYDEIWRLLPGLRYTYAFDNVASPHGEKSEESIVERVVEIMTTVQQRYPLSLTVIACNITSTALLPTLREKPAFPVVGVVPAIKSAAQLTTNGIVGLLATRATVKRSYTHELIARFANGCQIVVSGSAELIGLARAKLHGETVFLEELRRILCPWLRMFEPSDTVALGCTRFFLLQEGLLQVLPKGTRLVDSGAAITRCMAWLLEHEAPDAKPVDENVVFCMVMTTEVEQLLPVLQRYGFRTLEKLSV